MSQKNRREFIAAAGTVAIGSAVGVTLVSGKENEDALEIAMPSTTTQNDDNDFIYFAARTPYNTASGRYVKKLPAKSVLQWFQDNWNSERDSNESVGAHFYGLGSLFENTNGNEIPQSLEEVVAAIETRCYNNSIVAHEGAIEFTTDDDELHLVYHWFTPDFAEKNMDRVGFLIHEGWLPSEVNEISNSQPATYLCSRSPCQTCDSELWDYFEIPDIRLDQIGNVAAIMEAKRGADSYWLKKFLETVPNEFSWEQAIEKLVAEQCNWENGNNETEFHCSTHICEMRQHYTTHSNWSSKPKEFHQFVVFDDLWAAAHPTMVKSIRRFETPKILFS